MTTTHSKHSNHLDDQTDAALFAEALAQAKTVPEREALKAVRAFQDAFRAQDYTAWMQALNFPHVRLAKGRFEVYETAEAFLAIRDQKQKVLKDEAWHTTVTRSVEIVQSGAEKVHVALSNDRCRADGTPYNSFQTLWIATLLNGHWGIQFRSSFLTS